MNIFKFRSLSIQDCNRIKEIDASHYIKRAWREKDGEKQLVEINYNDPDFPGGFEEHRDALKHTILKNGFAIGVFDDEDKMVGFATVNREIFGKRFKYVLLDQLFITKEHRNKGLGKKLMQHCIDQAKNWKVDKLYICAGSAEETIAFYFAIGCKVAEEINQALYESDPRDFQLEYIL